MTLAEPSSDVLRSTAVASVTSRTGIAPPLPRVLPRRPTWERVLEGVLLTVAIAATAAGVAMRFAGPRALWLAEALTVNISPLPLTRLFDALRHDGSPPGYYVLLHYWMGAFGTSTRAVRALAGVCSVL